jgi:hypothetical protein
MDFDASSCYDRIIPSLSSLVSRTYRQHRNTCFIHARLLRNAKFKLKTKLGVSNISYSHCKDNPIYGTGQGSSCSPPIWGLISDKLFKVDAVGGNGANFVSPDTKVVEHVGAVGFVDTPRLLSMLEQLVFLMILQRQLMISPMIWLSHH